MQEKDISHGFGTRSLSHHGLLTPIYVPSEERYLEGLDAEQVTAVSSPSKDLAIIAPAGAGKSTTIAARARTLERKVPMSGEVIAVCFGHDAARSIGRKLSSAGSHARAMTIHSLALRLLRMEREASTGLPAVIKLCSIDGSEGDAALNAELRVALGRWVKSAKKQWPGGLTVRRAQEAVTRIESGGRADDKSEAYVWRMYARWMREHSRDDDIVTDYGYSVIRATQLVDDDRSRPVRVPIRTKVDLWSRVLPGQWRTIEVTRNPKTGLYHPHMHVLMLATDGYARAYHRDDPAREGLDWVRLDSGRYGSPYYRTSREWAEDWTASVLAAQGSSVSGSSMAVEDDPDGGLVVEAPQINGGRLLVDVRRTKAGSKDISEVTKYVTKDLEIIPPSLDDDEAAERLSVMDAALERVHLITQRGVYKTILDKALSGTLRDWMADDPRTAEPLDMDELVRRYQATLGSSSWSTDRWSYAGWSDGQYVERYRKDPTKDDDLDEDPFDDDDDEEW